MVEQWSGEIVAKMHTNGILKKDLAKKLGYSPEYTGKVLNGKVCPKKAETLFNAALDEILMERKFV